jgi:xanthine dehydrogenase YagS FAD-binding subunit
VSCTPRRITVAEETVKGKQVDAELAKVAGQVSTRGARPLNYNHFKVPLMANLVTRSLRDARS